MKQFISRPEHFEQLDKELAKVTATSGKLVSVRGRRQVGKSTLVELWLQKNKARHVFFTASKAGTDQNLRAFTDALKGSNLNDQNNFTGIEFTDWTAVLKQIAGLASPSAPSIIVIDEFPYMIEKDESFTSTIQQAWEDMPKKKPVLLVLIGSDIHMMEEISTYGEPLYGRARELVVNRTYAVINKSIVSEF